MNLNNITLDARINLVELDNSFVGTQNYMGLCYFWAYEYRHLLRGQKRDVWLKVHSALLNAGLDVTQESPLHREIIMSYIKG